MSERVLLAVKNGHAADILRRALHGFDGIEVMPIGAALIGRRYDRAVVLSLPSDSAAEMARAEMWVNHIDTKLPPGVKVWRAY